MGSVRARDARMLSDETIFCGSKKISTDQGQQQGSLRKEWNNMNAPDIKIQLIRPRPSNQS